MPGNAARRVHGTTGGSVTIVQEQRDRWSAASPVRSARGLVVHGREDDESRALFVVSSLYHCRDALGEHLIRFIHVDSVAVEIAVEVLSFDTGLNATVIGDDERQVEGAFSGAELYVGVALSDDRYIPRQSALAHHTPCLVLAQFPPLPRMTGQAVANLAAAQNPRRFAALLASRLR